MRILIFGAGAVGAVVGLALEQAGHEVAFVVRRGRRAALGKLLVVDAQGRARGRERLAAYELGEVLPPWEWILLAVRGDQLGEALTDLAAYGSPTARVALAAAALDGIERLRAAHPDGPCVTFLPTFSAHAEEPGLFHWFQPPLLGSFVSPEDDPGAAAAATELAQALDGAGVRCRTLPSTSRQLLPLLGPAAVFIGAWELAGWDAGALAGDRELRRITAAAIREAAAILGAASGHLGARLLSLSPTVALSALLATLPRLTPPQARRMWRHHGPKIGGQTRQVIADLIARGDGREVGALVALRQRLGPPPVEPSTPTAAGG